MKTQSHQDTSKEMTASSPRLDRVLVERMSAVFLAFFLGAFFLYGVGFSPAVHDLAHDTRHAIGFPCH